MLAFEIIVYTANSLRLVNGGVIAYITSITTQGGMEGAVGIYQKQSDFLWRNKDRRPCSRKVICNSFLGSSDYFGFVFVLMV